MASSQSRVREGQRREELRRQDGENEEGGRLNGARVSYSWSPLTLTLLFKSWWALFFGLKYGPLFLFLLSIIMVQARENIILLVNIITILFFGPWAMCYVATQYFFLHHKFHTCEYVS